MKKKKKKNKRKKNKKSIVWDIANEIATDTGRYTGYKVAEKLISTGTSKAVAYSLARIEMIPGIATNSIIPVATGSTWATGILATPAAGVVLPIVGGVAGGRVAYSTIKGIRKGIRKLFS